jgi:hypothetical protein
VADAFRQFGFEQNLCRTATAVRDTSPEQDEPGPVFTNRGATICGGHDWRGLFFVRRRCSLLAAGGRVMRGSLGEKIGEGAFSDVHAWAPGQVVKLFKSGVPRRLGRHEARVTRAVLASGSG